MNIPARAKYFVLLLCFVCAVSASTIFNSCNPKKGTDLQTTDDKLLSPKQLVSKYCTKCHAEVPTDALTNDVWQYHALPDMASFVGMSSYGGAYFKPDSIKTGISAADWTRIVNYYKNWAPEILPEQKRPDSLINDWAGFKVKVPEPTKDLRYVHTTMVSVDPQTHTIYSSDLGQLELYRWDAKLNHKAVATVPSPVVNMAYVKDKDAYKAILTCIGELEPMDFPNGRIVGINLNNLATVPQTLETDMSRPVQTSLIDVNKDGLQDYLVAARGMVRGHIYLLKQKADHTYDRIDFKNKEGVVQTIVGDFNNDGWQDFMALFGGGNEGVSLFTNNHNGGFTERRLLTFPPVYGASSLQVADIDKDGKLDVVVTCGYNYLDSRIKKPYHGLYIYKNTGNWNLKPDYFFPINGCTKAIAADFDNDGDIDIATSAFFADLQSQPAESFIYFEQDKAGHYKPHAIPVSKYGRWFDMAVGDYNMDGKPDIVLGNYSQGLSIEHNKSPYNIGDIPLIVLENHNGK